MLKKIHREGFTWKDSLFIHGIIVFSLIIFKTKKKPTDIWEK